MPRSSSSPTTSAVASAAPGCCDSAAANGIGGVTRPYSPAGVIGGAASAAGPGTSV